MQYTRIDEKRAEEQTGKNFIWPKGEYDFTILEDISFGTKTHRSSSYTKENGNNILKLAVKVFAKDGSDRTQHILDHIVTNFDGMEFKLRHLADACGLLSKYEAGTLKAEDFIHKSGKCVLGIQAGQPKNENDPLGEKYPDRNNIVDYVKRGSSTKDDLDDDLPDFMA